MSVLSLHEMVIVHATTKERRTLRVSEVYPREIALHWPLYGSLRFHCRNGKGIARASAWTIEKESLKRLHAALGIHEVVMGPATEGEGGQRE
jgi:hypothetical protein